MKGKCIMDLDRNSRISISRLIKDTISRYIYKSRIAFRLRLYKSKIFAYYGSLPRALSLEEQEILAYITHRGLKMYPYYFRDRYQEKDITVHMDKDLGLHYVLVGEKKMYFPVHMKVSRIRQYYNNLRSEQDRKSPHCYLTDNFNVRDGDIIADVGAAEGSFALSVIDRAKKVYLFETDKRWKHALEATFKPWREKVEITYKFVSNSNEDGNITLDTYFKNKGEVPDFIKIDAEGEERNILNGSRNIFRQSGSLKVAACTYHRNDDQVVLTDILQRNGFSTEVSDGLIFPFFCKRISPPYFRRGIIRATKQ